MNHWLLDAIAERRDLALREADRVQLHRELGREVPAFDEELLREVAAVLEIAVLDLTVDRLSDDDERRELLRQAAADAFRLMRVSVLAMLGDRGGDATQWLRALDETGYWPTLPLDTLNWGERCRATITDVWLRLVRKRGWSDRDAVLERVAALRSTQEEFERDYLHTFTPLEAKRSALELIAIYHLAKAADVLAHYITDGVVDGSYQMQPLLDSHFDRAVDACEAAQLVELGAMTRLLASASAQMGEFPVLISED